MIEPEIEIEGLILHVASKLDHEPNEFDHEVIKKALDDRFSNELVGKYFYVETKIQPTEVCKALMKKAG